MYESKYGPIRRKGAGGCGRSRKAPDDGLSLPIRRSSLSFEAALLDRAVVSSYRTLEGTLIRGFLVVILVWWEYEKGSRRRLSCTVFVDQREPFS